MVPKQAQTSSFHHHAWCLVCSVYADVLFLIGFHPKTIGGLVLKLPPTIIIWIIPP